MGGRGQSLSISGISRGSDTGQIGKIRNYVKNGAVGEYLGLKMDSVDKSKRQAVIAHELCHVYTAGQRYDSAEKAANNAFND